MRLGEPRFVFTCEHGGKSIPKEFASLFVGKARLLASHRGWDPGALQIARSLARSMQAPLVAGTTSRLLVDLNRSPGNPHIFSGPTAKLPRPQRDAILASYHAPHWNRVTECIKSHSASTIHIAVHSFASTLNGKVRPFAIGLLYDSKRKSEARFATAWQRALQDRLSRNQVRRNAPYRGDSDGLTTALRKHWTGHFYLGIELELNQDRIATPAARRALSIILTESLLSAVRQCYSS